MHKRQVVCFSKKDMICSCGQRMSVVRSIPTTPDEKAVSGAIGGAIVGGILFGGAGAIFGALAGSVLSRPNDGEEK